jgi:NAD(P)-dependent dehydrogenase (short-subunit alcohol dehydrogenase family)
MSAKALLVTGASRGIRRACALLAGRKGWAVGVNYREDAKAADAVVETIAKGGGRAVALKGDIAVEADVLGMFEVAPRALGPLSAVIANAGIVAPTAKLAEMSSACSASLRSMCSAPISPPARPRGECRSPPEERVDRSS